MLRRLYDWVVALADRRSAPWALGLVAFSESSVFIVPPDVLLAPMAIPTGPLGLGVIATGSTTLTLITTVAPASSPIVTEKLPAVWEWEGIQ